MPRNLDRRVEILVPVTEPQLRATIIHDILRVHLQDHVQSRYLLPDGHYEYRATPADDQIPASQEYLIQYWRRCTSR